MVKPLSIFVPVLSLCLLFILLLPLLTKPQPGKFQVSVTALSTTKKETPAPTAAPTAEPFDAPVPQSGLVASSIETLTYPGLAEFASGLLNGSVDDVVGVYIEGVLALPVVQQPGGRPDFVATEPNMLTQFSLPRTYGAVGILAHNYLSGSRFPQLREGTEIVLVYGGGQIKRYQVSRAEIRSRHSAPTVPSPTSSIWPILTRR